MYLAIQNGNHSSDMAINPEQGWVYKYYNYTGQLEEDIIILIKSSHMPKALATKFKDERD